MNNGKSDDLVTDMIVPERIIVIGGDKMASTREILPEVGFESHLLGDTRNNPIDLPSPPSILTYESYCNYNDDLKWKDEMTPRPNRVKIDPMVTSNDDFTPVKDDYTPMRDSRMMRFDISSIHLMQTSSQFFYFFIFIFSCFFLSSFDSNATPVDVVTTLRQQIRSLNRRISAIERENRQKDQRDMIIYSVGLVYIAMKALLYIKRNIL